MSAAVFLLSAAVLAHEVCLLRVLSLAWWHHAASLVVSVALLGFGVAGTLLALVPGLKRRRTIPVCAGLYALSIPLSLRAAGGVDFNILEVGWNPSQWLRLLAVEAIFFLPFVLAAVAILAALALRSRRPGRVYAANLGGSGAGALLAPPLLYLAPPAGALQAAALLAAAAALTDRRRALRLWGVGAGIAAVALGGRGLPMSGFKALEQAQQKTVLDTFIGPLGRVDRVAVPALHYAPGLSLTAPSLPERQEALYVDGHLVGARDLVEPSYLDHTVGALPFVLEDSPRTLLLGVGPDLARATDVVEINPDLLAASGAGGVAEDPRSFLERTRERYDLIVHHVPTMHAAAVTPLLTVEGLRAAFERTAPDGGVAVSCDLITPPRAGLKLLATAERVTPHLIAVRSLRRLCVWMRRRPPTDAERARVLQFCDDNGFDPVRPRAWRRAVPHPHTDTPRGPTSRTGGEHRPPRPDRAFADWMMSVSSAIKGADWRDYYEL
ncbi:MAG: hypothetical protein ACE5JG_11990, partial [Planctomycetota bacterium]